MLYFRCSIFSLHPPVSDFQGDDGTSSGFQRHALNAPLLYLEVEACNPFHLSEPCRDFHWYVNEGERWPYMTTYSKNPASFFLFLKPTGRLVPVTQSTTFPIHHSYIFSLIHLYSTVVSPLFPPPVLLLHVPTARASSLQRPLNELASS